MLPSTVGWLVRHSLHVLGFRTRTFKGSYAGCRGGGAARGCQNLEALPVGCGWARATQPRGLPVFTWTPRLSRCELPSLPASSPEELACPSCTTLPPPGLPSALLSRLSSPQATPTPKLHFRCQLPHRPPPRLPRNPHFPFLCLAHLQRLV